MIEALGGLARLARAVVPRVDMVDESGKPASSCLDEGTRGFRCAYVGIRPEAVSGDMFE